MPRPTRYVTRSDLGWSPTSPAAYADPKSGLVIHYDSNDQNLAGKSHSACITYWNNTRAFHTGPSRGWADVGYAFFSCAHGYVIEGRGLYREQAAQPGGNRTHYSCTLATGPNDEITAEQINAVRELRQWLMEPDTSISGDVLGHRDFSSTSCPGERAYSLVQDGTFAQPPGAALNQMGMNHMLGLRKGDEGLPVQDLQAFLNDAGFRPANSFSDGSWDGVYGQGVSDAVLAARKSMGSSASNGDYISYWASNQIRRAWFRRQFELAMATVDTGGSASLPSTETLSVTGGQITVER